MKDGHGMTLAHCVAVDTAASQSEALTQFSRSVVRIRRRIEGASGPSRTEPATWSGTQFEDVIATLDGVADIAARAADRLRGYRDSM